jgi:hypothetical protein
MKPRSGKAHTYSRTSSLAAVRDRCFPIKLRTTGWNPGSPKGMGVRCPVNVYRLDAVSGDREAAMLLGDILSRRERTRQSVLSAEASDSFPVTFQSEGGAPGRACGANRDSRPFRRETAGRSRLTADETHDRVRHGVAPASAGRTGRYRMRCLVLVGMILARGDAAAVNRASWASL